MSAAKPFAACSSDGMGHGAPRPRGGPPQPSSANEEGHVVALAVLPPAWHTETAQERSANEVAARERSIPRSNGCRPSLPICAVPGSTCNSARIRTSRKHSAAMPPSTGSTCSPSAVMVSGAAARKLGHVADSAARSGGIPLLPLATP